MPSNPTEFAIPVTSEDTTSEKKDNLKQEGSSKLSKDKKKDEETEGEELSEELEDQQLKDELEMLAERRLKESNADLYKPALETLRTLIRTSTSSMTSVPKPLKFLHPLYPGLQTLYEMWEPSENKSLFADILSVLAMTCSDTQPRGTLRYRLLAAEMRPAGSPLSDPGSWGHEYIRHLAAELGDGYNIREQEDNKVEPVKGSLPVPKVPGTLDDLRALAEECAAFLLDHNAGPDTIDLLQELEIVEESILLVDKNTYTRVCQYLISFVNLLPPPDDFLRTAHTIYARQNKFSERQLAFILARAQILIERLPANPDDNIDIEDGFPKDIREHLSNTRLSTHLREFGKELGLTNAKNLEEVYKTHLENTKPNALANVDSARGNLAGSFVNAFVNAGYGNDKLMVEAEEGNSWVYKNKEHGALCNLQASLFQLVPGMLSAAASLQVGVSLRVLWDTEVGFSHIDKYTYSSEEYIKAGALLATGILSSGVRTEADVAKGLIGEYVDNKSVPLQTSATVGLGLAYAGAHRQDLLELLPPQISDDVSMEIAGLAALALGFIFVSSQNGEITGTILQVFKLMEKAEQNDVSLDEKWALGLGLLYLGLQDALDTTIETLKAIEHPIAKTAQVTVEGCAFAGTGNVLKIQAMLQHCDEHIVEKKEEKKDDKKEDAAATTAPAAGTAATSEATPKEENKEDTKSGKQDDTFQSFAILAVSLISMGEEIGAEMALRQFHHLMHYGEPVIRKVVPLAIGLNSVSNPQLPILDTLSKYSHNNDLAVALNAIFAMGLVGAGTNNARLAQMLRQLAGYYYKEPDCLFMVRVAQGLVHMGKGTIGLNPFYSDQSIMSRPAVAGLLAVLTAFTDAKHFILDKYHWMLYFLVPAMYPRFLITVDEELNPKPVTVRVGQALDVVGYAGKPRTISGFQTHQTPVRLATKDRAELATEEYIPFAPVLEVAALVLGKKPRVKNAPKGVSASRGGQQPPPPAPKPQGRPTQKLTPQNATPTANVAPTVGSVSQRGLSAVPQKRTRPGSSPDDNLNMNTTCPPTSQLDPVTKRQRFSTLDRLERDSQTLSNPSFRRPTTRFAGPEDAERNPMAPPLTGLAGVSSLASSRLKLIHLSGSGKQSWTPNFKLRNHMYRPNLEHQLQSYRSPLSSIFLQPRGQQRRIIAPQFGGPAPATGTDDEQDVDDAQLETNDHRDSSGSDESDTEYPRLHATGPMGLGFESDNPGNYDNTMQNYEDYNPLRGITYSDLFDHDSQNNRPSSTSNVRLPAETGSTPDFQSWRAPSPQFTEFPQSQASPPVFASARTTLTHSNLANSFQSANFPASTTPYFASDTFLAPSQQQQQQPSDINKISDLPPTSTTSSRGRTTFPQAPQVYVTQVDETSAGHGVDHQPRATLYGQGRPPGSNTGLRPPHSQGSDGSQGSSNSTTSYRPASGFEVKYLKSASSN
ncbi:26S proteasome regulatory subunit RPN1 [Mycena indigotica]|uniref:26S proteasome regulatory subunit RPN1 n=1 Tax=Mycena indigotica TaxID=2126181 RepID=A0A8H6RZK9_9AGAR|nr:26S proteasome regulatory subunit RPN1 [Mycena indigotica]KAF7290615.1 26S proteasome regulatory subunit RPN1 [Mycena indigotica]